MYIDEARLQTGNQQELLKLYHPAARGNTASVAALTGPGGMCAYAASKQGVHGLTRVASMENGAYNIRVNSLAPGWTEETPMVAVASAQNPAFAKQAISTRAR
jgi:NAD(P)-dependent dehydrogenase (short-subunit alcohol dehydrogenase family)